jgi:hypothetical protein
MFKKMRTFVIDLQGKINESKEGTLVELDPYWVERIENGAELAVITTPAIPTDQQLVNELLVAEIQSLSENYGAWEPDQSNCIDSFLMALFSFNGQTPTESRSILIQKAMRAIVRVRRNVNRTLDRFSWEGKRYAHQAIDDTKHIAEVDMGITMLKIDRNCKLSQQMDPARPERPMRGPLTTKTLLGRRYPGIRIVQVTVPTRMTDEQKSAVRNKLNNIVWNGRRYKLTLATGGLKNGQVICIEEKFAKSVARQYHMVPQAALAYGGIVVNECTKALATFEATVKVVKEGDLGTNDSRGWMDESVFSQLKTLDPGHFDQFRMDFIANATTLVQDNILDQIAGSLKLGLNDTPVDAKGVLKVMRNEIGAHPLVAANIVIPDSCLKPARPDLIGKSFRCVINLGITEQSYDGSTFGGPTVATHAPEEILMTEVFDDCAKLMTEVGQGFHTEGHLELLKKIGADNKSDTDYMRVMEACLVADGCGTMMRHPFIHSGAKRLLAKWMRKLLSGGIEMQTRALADDGFLIVDKAGKLHQGHDWMPQRAALTDYEGDRSLCIRFPVRMREDLLPVEHINRSKAIEILSQTFPDMTLETIEQAVNEQLYLKHVHVLNGKYAKVFGGDFDFDLVYILPETRYPKLVDWRFKMEERTQPTKNKKKREDGWHEIGRICFDAMSNKVGQITNTIMSAIAADKLDLVYPLAEELQEEVSGLKHDTSADMKRVEEIKKQIGGDAKWIKMLSKDDIRSFDDLPEHIEPLSDGDVIAKFYNKLYVTANELIGSPRSLSNYAGLFDGQYGDTVISKDDMREASLANAFYGSQSRKAIVHSAKKREALNAARTKQADLRTAGKKEEAREMEDGIRQLEAAYEQAQLDTKKGLGFFRNIICAWGNGKQEEKRMYWAAVLNEVITRKSAYSEKNNQDSKSQFKSGTGSSLMHAFPQQFVDAVAASTEGRSVIVDTWKYDWSAIVNVEALTITKVETGEDGQPKETLLYQGFPVKKTLPNGNTITVTEWKRRVELDLLGIDLEEDELEAAQAA